MSSPFATSYQEFIHQSRYAKWLPSEGRRETWDETCDRYIGFFKERFPDADLDWDRLRSAIFNLEVMPSMRCLMTAGPALARDEIAGYNCSFVRIDNPRAFSEILFVLMNGTGVGFSAEHDAVRLLPEIAEHFEHTEEVVVVGDSKEGWARAYAKLISRLYVGEIPTLDLSKVRPAGEPLKTFGGRASGPEPFHHLIKTTVKLFVKAAGRRLTTLEVHDLVCSIAEIVVVGGVRRSALISLSDLNDHEMRHAKSGSWWMEEGQRALANNSAVYNGRPSIEQFMSEWLALIESKSGERGIFNRAGAIKSSAEIGRTIENPGTNPCGEILLNSAQFCNLSEVVVRPDDTAKTLKEKVRIATIFGTLQSSLQNFNFLRSIWKKNTVKERLLGVSMTGMMDNPLLNSASPKTAKLLEELRDVAWEVNKEVASLLGLETSAAITAIKPSGTTSALNDTASGIHSRFAPYYIRRVRADIKDPLTEMMKDQGVPCEPCVMKPDSTVVFSFPMKAPKDAVFQKDITAIDQLEHWRIVKHHYTDHNPSVTVYVAEDEWLEVGSWCYKNFDDVVGISFLPRSDAVYQQAPFEEIDEETYNRLAAEMPSIDWTELHKYEKTDHTTAAQELACTGGSCEIV